MNILLENMDELYHISLNSLLSGFLLVCSLLEFIDYIFLTGSKLHLVSINPYWRLLNFIISLNTFSVRPIEGFLDLLSSVVLITLSF